MTSTRNPELWNANWLLKLQQQATQAPAKARHAVLMDGKQIGSVQFGVMEELISKDPEIDSIVTLEKSDGLTVCNILGPATQSLNKIAHALREQDMAGVRKQWRDEQLAVCDADSGISGTIERGAVRALGIATRAVHLIGFTRDGRHWLQQRALTKATDPGMWDTLVGGLVPASDTLEQALERETWEEAGLGISRLIDVRHGGVSRLEKPNSADGGVGYMVERIDWYTCVVPEGMTPANQDGEVAQFDCVDREHLLQMLQADEFTVEAALLYTFCLG